MIDTDRPNSQPGDSRALDREITRLYTMGESTMSISKRLGMRPAEVIGRVRALNLSPPNMAFRRPTGRPPGMPAAPEPEPASPTPIPAAETVSEDEVRTARLRRHQAARTERPAPSSPSAAARPVLRAEETDDDADGVGDLSTLPGRPRGWLVTEGDLRSIFAHHRGRFEDVPLRRKPR